MTKVQELPMSWIGFDSMRGRLLAGAGSADLRDGLVPPEGFAQVRALAQQPFRGTRCYVRHAIASHFLIHDLVVGTTSSFVAVGAPIPADAFAARMDNLAELEAVLERDGVVRIIVEKNGAELAGAPWVLPLATIGSLMVMSIENISDGAHRFVAGFSGEIDYGGRLKGPGWS